MHPGSHHDLAGLSTSAEASSKHVSSGPNTPEDSSLKKLNSHVGLAAPKISVKEVDTVPAMKLPGGPAEETTKD